jgi:hypothetical protein
MLGRYALSLLLTILIETGVAYLLGFRTRWYLLTVAVINVITNPVLNYLLLVLGWLGMDVTLALVIPLEILVAVAEWRLLVYVFGGPKGRLLILSVLANAASFLIGLPVFWT